MYELKRLLPTFDINLPTTMYHLKNLGLDSIPQDADINGCESGALSNSSSPYTKLEYRQERVLNQLNELKTMLTDIRSSLNTDQNPTQNPETASIDSTAKGQGEKTLENIVINAHPNAIPYALLCLKNLWKPYFNIDVTSYLHSTIEKLSPEAIKFQQKLCENVKNSLNPSIDIRLIWKDCEHTEMISSPTMYVPIYGEVNIIRYLSRVGPTNCDYENTPMCNEVDTVLDISHQLWSKNSAKADLLSILSERLQKKKFFAGDVLSIADIGLFSALKSLPKKSSSSVTATLNSWSKRVENVISI